MGGSSHIHDCSVFVRACVCVYSLPVGTAHQYRRPAVGRPFPSYMMRTDTPTCDVTKGFHVAVDVTAYRTRKHTVAPPPHLLRCHARWVRPRRRQRSPGESTAGGFCERGGGGGSPCYCQ
ncbi:unnamed protein product [Arctogadus glacialis]